MLTLGLGASNAPGQAVISEFMASNARTLADAEGDYSDWIELHNPGNGAVNLDGWFLTDDAGLLRKWRLPDVTLQPDEFLLVFASGKDRAVAGQELHTNFRLNADGGYLGLVRPDGVTLASQFNYPAQRVDISYGEAAPFATMTLVAADAAARVWIPTNAALGSNWTLPGFVPTGWLAGTNGVGYGLADPPQPPAAGRRLWLAADAGVTTDGSGNLTGWADAGGLHGNWIESVRGTPRRATAPLPQGERSVIRFDGNIDGLTLVDDPELRLNPLSIYVVASIDAGERGATFIGDYRDISGYALGISDSVSQRVKWFTAPLGDAFDDGLASFPAADLTPERNYLLTATFDAVSNTKVLRVLNESGTNSYSASGTFHAQASYAADTQLTVGNLDFGRQFLDGDIAEILVYDSVSEAQREAVEAYLMNKYFSPQPAAPSPLVSTDVSAVMAGVNASAFLRMPFALDNAAAFDKVFLRLQYDDGFVAYLDGREIARRNAPGTAGLPLPFDAAAVTDRPLAAARLPESIDVTTGAASLAAGDHLLAIQGLNDDANSPDFLIRAELTAASDLTPALATGYLQTPTPGARNNSDAYLGVVADTKFSPDRGFYDAPISVTMTSATPGAEIRYTLDGSLPTANQGAAYATTLTISATTTLRAAAVKPGWLPTAADTHTYVFVNDVIGQSPDGQPPPGWPASPLPTGQVMDYGMDPEVVTNPAYGGRIRDALKSIPSFSIVMDPNDLFGPEGIYANPGGDGREWERPGSIELLRPDGHTGFQINAGVRIRGGQSRMVINPKHAFRFFFRGEYGASSLPYRMFANSPLDRFQMFDLRMDQNDSWSFVGDCCGNPNNAVYLRDVFSRDTQLAMGEPSTRSDYYHLYLNGQYWGLANTQERPEAVYAAAYFGGTAADYDVVKVNWGTFTLYATDGDMAGWTELYNLIRAGVGTEAAYQKLLGNNADGTRNPAFPIYLDADNLIDFMLITLYTANLDSAISTFSGRPNNWYAIRPRDGRAGFRFIVHDAEIAMLNVNADRTAAPSNAGDASVLESSPEWMWHRLLVNPTFRLRAADRIHKHFFNDGVFTPASSKARFLARKAEIDLAIIAESARWGDTRRATPYTRDVEWLNLVNQLAVNPNAYFDLRPSVVLAQLTSAGIYPALAAPSLSQFGGMVVTGTVVTLTAPAGAIYYTLDGSDPRTLAGGVSPAANLYAGPVTLNESAVVRARSFDGAAWSALTEATFEVARAFNTLRITEIMYHPLPGLDQDGTAVDGNEFEFLELKNAGTNTLNLGGMAFRAGVSFTFTNGTRLQPGQFFVLARNPDRFAARYPGVAVNGVYTGKLDNSGETLRLAHVLGTPAVSVTYGQQAPWPVPPDGDGFSLVPKSPDGNIDPDNPANWRSSAVVGGSPGADDPEPDIPPVLVNEVLSASEPPQTDAVELFNPTGADLDLGGWFLTDDPGQPTKYRIPAGSIIAAGGYLVFDETAFNPTPGTNNSFAFSSAGEAAYLFSGGAATNLTGYSHGFSFGAAAPGETFGRYVLSTGEEDFPAQIAPSPRAANLGPRVGPVVINEIHYRPGAGEDEFVELKNVAATNVALFDPERWTNTWKLSGLGFAFPTNLLLAPGQLLLLVDNNPASFRARYSVPAVVPILGPWSGVLQNGGERLELQRPGPPDTNGVVPYLTVDAVRYNDQKPWPAGADGSGPSLQRMNDGAYGNDPASWTAALASPGRLFSGGSAPLITGQPADVTVALAGEATFQVVAAGAAPLFYQWHFDGTPLAGATGSILTLTNLQPDQAGAYSVIAFNEAGSAESQPAVLRLFVPARILTQPGDIFVRVRPDPLAAPSTNVTFTVLAASTSPLRYQWRFNGLELPGATNTSLTISDVQAPDGGAYDVAVTAAEGTVLSATAHLYPLISPVILQQPLSQTAVAGGTVTLSVVFTASPAPFSNEWRQGSTLMATHFLDGFADFFTFSVPNFPTTLPYRAWIRNLATPSGGTLSTTATITVLADADADGLPDVWESAYGIDDPNADSDGDGVKNGEEYQAGTNPTNALSFLSVEISASPRVATLRFGAVSNLTYTLQCQNEPGSGGWTKLADVAGRHTNHVETIMDTNWGSGRFYRVVTPRQP
jgi:Chitobiase/beta-hexosaminidase C-terminal domain/CotH kinase protein/Lamin Tail Domain/Bacterial TSP3 repeat